MKTKIEEEEENKLKRKNAFFLYFMLNDSHIKEYIAQYLQ
jgi:hypothetical protein